MLFNRYAIVRWLDRGIEIGGRQNYSGSRVTLPPDIKFSVTHSSGAAPNEASVTIYNLSPEVQRAVMVEGDKVQIEAGYWPVGGEQFTAPIFVGQIRTAITNTANGGVETETVFSLGDGDDAFARSRCREIVSGSDGALKSALSAFKDAGVTIGKFPSLDYQSARPITLDRPARFVLDDLSYQHDLQWSVQDGVLNVYARDEALKETDLILSPDVGVIDSPVFSDKGASVKTLMLPELRPGMTFRLEAKNSVARFSETLKIESVAFSGDTSGGDFGAQIEAKYMDGKKVIRSRERFWGART